MVSCFISRLVILVFGTLYPAYASYKAVRTKNVKEYVKWMMYWIVFALFTCAETFTDLFLSFWFPFYYEIKIITVIYLLSPATKGSSILYRKFVHPVLTKREQEIDEYIAKAKEQGYHTMLNLGSKGVTYATSLIMQTAIKGGGGLVSQLKKSYSLGDLSEEQHLRNQKRESEDDVDSQYDEDPRVLRRLPVRSPRRTISSASQSGLYFPEVDTDQRHIGEHIYGQIPSSEEISSGYSSGDPLYYGMAGSEGSHLVRTASLGATSRVRTRAASRNGLPKRASLSEGGSTRSALEPSESQIEIERYYNLPPARSAPISFPFASLNHLVRPEYQHLFGNVTQNQMFTFINHSQYPQPLNNNTLVNVESETFGSPSVAISEANEHPGNSEKPPSIPEAVAIPDIKVDESGVETQIQDRTAAEKTEGRVEVDSVEKCGDEKEKDKQLHERSGKYNKKPAPTPPAEESNAESGLVVEEEEESEFCTPSASPTPVRKHDFPVEKTVAADENEAKVQRAEVVDVPRKSRPKTKKGEFNISKKLHMPKMSFSFWNQKSGKHSSGSEMSLVGNAEGDKRKAEDKSELEVFIPLRDGDEKENAAEDETKTDPSQRQN